MRRHVAVRSLEQEHNNNNEYNLAKPDVFGWVCVVQIFSVESHEPDSRAEDPEDTCWSSHAISPRSRNAHRQEVPKHSTEEEHVNDSYWIEEDFEIAGPDDQHEDVHEHMLEWRVEAQSREESPDLESLFQFLEL